MNRAHSVTQKPVPTHTRQRASVALIFASIASSLTTGCSSENANTSDLIKHNEATASISQPLTNVAQDRKGNHWRLRGPAKFVTTSNSTPQSPSNSKGPTDEEIHAWSDEEWANQLRPVTLINGYEYELSEVNWSTVQRAMEQRALGGHPSHNAPSTTTRLTNTVNQVIDTDDRFPVYFEDAVSYPNSAVGVMTSGNDFTSPASAACTMTMIGPSTALSSAHCFWDVQSKAWYPAKTWQFGASIQPPNAALAYGPMQCYWVTIPSAFQDTDTIFNDYAVVEFSGVNACNLSPGNSIGWFGWWVASDAQITGLATRVTGYPVSPPAFYASSYPWPSEYARNGAAGSLWVDASTSYIIRTSLDSTGGDSGAGYAQAVNGGTIKTAPYVTAINKGSQGGVTTNNWARRIDATVEAFVYAYSAL